MTAVYLPVTEPVFSGAWFWVSLLIVPMVMGLIRYEHKPKIRRLLAAGCLAIALAVVMSAEDDTVIPDPCYICHQLPEGSWERWYCFLINFPC